LNKSRELVIESFNKNEESLNDGMDIILCRYDIKSRRLEFSGANRPLWVMRNENKILEEFKTDRQPVGKFITSNSFSSFEIDIDSNDMIYMFSDGYIDQFGGDDESKFKTSRFRDLINKIKYIQIKEQESTIKTNFEEWKGSFEQTDDICVWGIML
jgi:serine phosphatase RsbU (regulator of sigma subunit)